MDNNYDVITVGGATLDIFLDIPEEELHSQSQTIAIPLGSKITVEALSTSVGGNAANVAVGLSRLGKKVATYVHYGDDELSQKILHTLENEHVSTEYMVQDKNQTSSIGIALNVAGERTLFVHHIKRNHSLPAISIPKMLYLTSVGEYWETVYQQVLDFVEERPIQFALSPGTHQLNRGVGSFLAHVKRADILCVNKEEAMRIAEIENGDPKEILSRLLALGTKTVSMTDGSNGAYAASESGIWRIKAYPAVCIERTGAGDAYASGFLGSMVNGKDIPTAMKWGAINAANVIREVGAQKGLLSYEKILQIEQSSKDFTAEAL